MTTKTRRSTWAVLTATVATFLALFTLLAQQLRTGHDPALLASPAALTAPTTHGTTTGLHLVTTASGGHRLVAGPGATASGHAVALPTLVTHTSGGGHGEDD